ncbi:MAG: hypothetical protein K6G09_08020 [Treponema sp.]|nr:hypothetical protein [Treponema sp.]
MAVFHIICKIILIYLFVCFVLAVYDTVKTFYGVITHKIQGNDDDMKIFSILEMIFLPSIFIYAGIFTVISKIFNLPDEDELENS